VEGLPVGLLALPDTGGLSASAAARVVVAAADVCARQRWFLLVDPSGSLTPAAIETWARHLGSHPNAAAYIPRLRLPDGTETAASGAVAGVVARTDIERGVWVAPAGLRGRLQGVADVARESQTSPAISRTRPSSAPPALA
jgi:Bacteriophage tail sheath protein